MLVQQAVTLGRGVGGKNPHLAVLDFSQRTALLLGNVDGIIALLNKRGLIQDQNSVLISHIIADQSMIPFQDHTLISLGITDHPLHGSNTAPSHRQRNGLSGFPIQLTELPGHVTGEILAGVAPGKTIPEYSMKPLQLIHKSFYISFVHGKLRDGKYIVLANSIADHRYPPFGNIVNCRRILPLDRGTANGHISL